MKIDTIMLHGVTIKGNPDPNRTRYLNMFKKNFIGISPNASECEILNPDDIYLSYDEKDAVLNAQSVEFIKIENRGLGYTVNYLINNFELNTKTNVSSYNVKPFFTELTGTREERKKWEANRKLAYLGSIRHFFKTMFNNTTKAEGFLVYQIPENSYNQDQAAIHLTNVDSIYTTVDKNFRLFKLQPISARSKDTSRLYIVYTKSTEPSAFYNYSPDHIELPVKLKNKKSQVSELVLYTSDVLFDKNGNLAPVNKTVFLGYWSLERAADLMPLDYPTTIAKPK